MTATPHPTSGRTFAEGFLAGKTAFLTGSNGGITLRIAERYAQAGAQVILNGRNEEKLAAAVASLTSQGLKAVGYSADVRNYDALSACFQKAHQQFGEIDLLVCGAAGNFPAPAMGISTNGFKAVTDIDTLGTFNACKAAFEYLRKPGASILNISAPQAYVAMPFQIHVCAAKAGVDMITRCLALEWGAIGIRVNSVAPGPIEDTEGMTRLAPDPSYKEAMTRNLAIKRFGTKDDVADLALFLASEAASYITGTVIPVDGGQSLSGPGPFLEMFQKGGYA